MRLVRVQLAAAAAVIAALLAFAVPALGTSIARPAGSSGRWSIRHAPYPSDSSYSQLEAVHCLSAKKCFAVGSADTGAVGAPSKTLAEVWNGRVWKIVKTPNVKGAIDNYLYGVSCTSARFCVAVGGAYVNAGDQTLALVWNGRSWRIVKTPAHANASSYLMGVSCTSARACAAVGDSYEDGPAQQVPLAEIWNGRSFTTRHTPTVAAGGVTLSGVACTSASACLAVGFSDYGSNTAQTVAERWNGRSWRISDSKDAAGFSASALNAVSCPRVKMCTSVGYAANNNGNQGRTLIEVWNGRSWKIRSSPNPDVSSRGSTLTGVSCSAKACTAVGFGSSNVEGEPTVVEQWNGKSWKLRASPNPHDAANGSQFYGVSCASAKACTAVGEYEPAYKVFYPLIESDG